MDSKRLQNETVHEVCKLLEEGYRYKEIAEKFNINYKVVMDIKRGRTYKHISKNYDMTKIKYKTGRISDETVHEVCKLIEIGLTNKEISDKLNISSITVSDIRGGRTYKYIANDYNLTKLFSRAEKMSDEDAQKVCKLLEEGYSNKEIADKLNINVMIICDIRRNHSYKTISKNYNISRLGAELLDEEVIHKICKLLEDGYRNHDISIDLNIDACAISEIRNGARYRNISKEYNISKRYHRSKIDEDKVHEICKMKQDGMNVKDIAKEVGIGFTSIYRALKIPKFEHIRRQ